MPQTNFIQAINQAIAEEMERDPLTFLMGEDVVLGAFGATKGLVDKFGAKRVRNTPISEAGFVGAAVGAAMAGTRPICEVEFASFFYCAFDQVCNQAAKLRYMSGGQATMPITFRAVFGAMGGAAAQHSETVYAQFLSVPGLKLVVPSGPSDMKGLLKSAIRDNNPVIVFEHGALGRLKEDIPAGEHLVPLGKAAVKRPGENVTVVAIGAMVPKAMSVAAKLENEKISVEVIDPRTLVPLDEDAILASVEKTNRIVIADEGHLRGGAAADIAAIVADKGFDFLDAPVRRVTSLTCRYRSVRRWNRRRSRTRPASRPRYVTWSDDRPASKSRNNPPVSVKSRCPTGSRCMKERFSVPQAAGRTVNAGEPLYEVETEKVLHQVEAPASGSLAMILFDEGATIECGVAVAVIAETARMSQRSRART